MARNITLIVLACAGLCAVAAADEVASPEVSAFVKLVTSRAKSPTPLSTEQQHEVTQAVYALLRVASRSPKPPLKSLASEAFLTAIGKLTSSSQLLHGKNAEDLDVCRGLSNLLNTVFWSKDLSPEDAKRVLAAEIGILKRYFEEDERLKKAGASPGVVMIYDVVGEGPSAEELRKQESMARYNLVERAEWDVFEDICRAARKFEPGTMEQRKSCLMAAGLTEKEIEKCLRLGRAMDAEAFERHPPL